MVRAEPSEVFALFVGIDRYAGVSQGPHELHNLSGAKNDVKLIQKVLALPKFGVALNDATHVKVLVDEGATREAIGTWLNTMIERAAARENGATVLFFFSGHGARIQDDVGDQASGFESTLVPYDGRIPGQPMRDIVGRDLKKIIARANEMGVHVVTIFDSCNSGSATRSFNTALTREAPPLIDPGSAVPPLPMPKVPSGFSAGLVAPGTHVHLAAAESFQSATEREGPPDGVPRGDFTAALAETLEASAAGTSYEDIMTRVRGSLDWNGIAEHPHPEGPLDRPFLGEERDEVLLYEANRDGPASYQVLGGRLSGVTDGSRFDVYDSSTSAINHASALSNGEIHDAQTWNARLELASALKPNAPDEVWLRETSHDFGQDRLRLYVAGAPTDVTRITTLAADLNFLEIVREPRLAQLVLETGAKGSRLLTVDGVPLTFRIKDDGTLWESLRKIARYFALLRLQDAGRGEKITLVVKHVCDDRTDCPPFVRNGGAYVLPAGSQFEFDLINESKSDDYFIYLLHLGSDFKIEQLYPPEGDHEQLAKNGDFVSIRDALRNDLPFCATIDLQPSESPTEAAAAARNDIDRVMVVSTDHKVNLSALSQEGVYRGMPAGHSASPLEQLIDDANLGHRSMTAVSVGKWNAALFALTMVPSSARCPSSP